MSDIVPYNFQPGEYRVHIQSDDAIGEVLGGNNVESNTFYFNNYAENTWVNKTW